MPTSQNSICGIDFRKDCICLALHIPVEKTITSAGIRKLESSSEPWWKTARNEFVQLVTDLKLGKQDAVFSMPAEHAIIKKISIDKDEEMVADVIRWEISQQVLGSMDGYSFDYQPLQRDTHDGYSDYLAVAYRQDVIGKYQDIMRAARLNPVIVDLDIFALVNIFELSHSDYMAKPAIIVLGDLDKIILVLTQNGTYVDLEIIDHQYAPRDSAGCLDAIQKGIPALLSSNPAVTAAPPVFLAGQLFVETEIAAGVLGGIEGAAMLDPFATIVCRAAMSEEDMKRFAPQLAVATGLAARGGTEISHD
jgi:hypothetical protein